MQNVKLFGQKHKVIAAFLVVLLLGGLGAGGYFAYNLYKVNTSPDNVFQKEAKEYKQSYEDMLRNAGLQVGLPQDEVPVIATVTDKNSLADQQFFSVAENGDKIIMFKKNKKVFLYRPALKKVVAEASLQFKEEDAAVAGTSDDTASSSGDVASNSGKPTFTIE